VAMVGMARAQEVTAVAVASDADRAEAAPTQEFAKRETRVGRIVIAFHSLALSLGVLALGCMTDWCMACA
jgi:hypothetical protein